MKIETRLITSERAATYSIVSAVIVLIVCAVRPYASLIDISTSAIRNIPDLLDVKRQLDEESILTTCVNNLRRIDSAKEQAGIQYAHKEGEAIPDSEVAQFLPGGSASQVCPKEGHYVLNGVGQEPECSVHGALTLAETARQAISDQASAKLQRAMDRTQQASSEALKQLGISIPSNNTPISTDVTRLATCVNNLQRITNAKMQVTLKDIHKYYNKPIPVPIPEQEVLAAIEGGLASLVCPNGGHYIIREAEVESECSVDGPLPTVLESYHVAVTNYTASGSKMH